MASFIGGCTSAEECYAGRVVEKMDSAASRCMSGVPGRLVTTDSAVNNVSIRGFNGSVSNVTSTGTNADGKIEHYVANMGNNLVLLCANDYARDGFIVLFGDDGIVCECDSHESDLVREFISQFAIRKRLKVNNRTYEVDDTPDNAFDANAVNEIAYGSSANTYFNTKINVSNVEERILAYLISGFSLEDLLRFVKAGSLAGLHPDITTTALNRYQHKWGRSPDAFQLARASKQGNTKGYMEPPKPLTHVGERVEMDYFECPFNMSQEDDSSNDLRRKKIKKLPTHGGAIAAAVCVDSYSGKVFGRLVKSTARPIVLVQEFYSEFDLEHHTIDLFCGDKGVLSQSTFQVFTPEVESYCKFRNSRIRRSEPYNHSNGSPYVEEVILRVKELITMAVQYILRNPNWPSFGFTQTEILMLWGEFFGWSLAVINLRSCTHVSAKTKEEVFTGRRPNIQTLRMLPIGAVVMVLRYVENAATLDNSIGEFYQDGLYVGPAFSVAGGIRVAVKTGNSLQIIVSTKYKGVSDGGGMNIYQSVQRGLMHMADPPTRNEVFLRDNEQNHFNAAQRRQTTVPVVQAPSLERPISIVRSDTTKVPKDNTIPTADDTLVPRLELSADNSIVSPVIPVLNSVDDALTPGLEFSTNDSIVPVIPVDISADTVHAPRLEQSAEPLVSQPFDDTDDFPNLVDDSSSDESSDDEDDDIDDRDDIAVSSSVPNAAMERIVSTKRPLRGDSKARRKTRRSFNKKKNQKLSSSVQAKSGDKSSSNCSSEIRR